MQAKASTSKIFTIAMLVLGNLLGAGILAMPVDTALSGFIPSLFAMLVFASAMLFSAVILAHEANETKSDTFNYPSLYRKYLGAAGQWVATLSNLLILYGLLTAYLTGATSIVTNVFGMQEYDYIILFGFFIILTLITISDISIIKKYNIVFMVVLWGSFIVIAALGAGYIDPDRFGYFDWAYLSMAVPIIVTGFHFHNIIPTLCRDMNWDNNIWKPFAIGIAMGFVMNLLWIIVGTGSLPLYGTLSMFDAHIHSFPVTVEMSKLIHTPLFNISATLFALLAITLAFMANGMGLLDFSRDWLKNTFSIDSRKVTILFTFIPPIVISYLMPNIFLQAIGVVGGIGIVILFGVLPSIIAIMKLKQPFWKFVSIVMLIIFLAALTIKSLQLLGVMNIQPNVAHLKKETIIVDVKGEVRKELHEKEKKLQQEYEKKTDALIKEKLHKEKLD